MGTIPSGKTPGLWLVEALPAELVALGLSICDTTRDGSRVVGNSEVRPQGSTFGLPVIRSQWRASLLSIQLPLPNQVISPEWNSRYFLAKMPHSS